MTALSSIRPQSPAQSINPAPDDAIAQLEDTLLNFAEKLLTDAFESVAAPQSQPEIGATTAPPLKVDGDKIITPGGFSVFTKGPSEWVIEDPYGHCTHISGDPHVAVDGVHVFDFKRETSFLLPDGTRIACKTKPAGNGATLSSEFTVMTGNEKVTVTGVDGGQPQIGKISAMQPGELQAYAADEDVLSYGLENHHAGWNLLRDESGQHETGEVTGSLEQGEKLEANGHLMKYVPLEGEKGPCEDEPHGYPPPTEGGHAGGPTNELPNGFTGPTHLLKHRKRDYVPSFNPPANPSEPQVDQLGQLIAFALRRAIVG